MMNNELHLTPVEKNGKLVLSNEKCYVEFRPTEKEIFGRDLTDHYNEPAFYTKTKRNIKVAWKNIVDTFNETTTMNDVTDAILHARVRYHSWCMVD